MGSASELCIRNELAVDNLETYSCHHYKTCAITFSFICTIYKIEFNLEVPFHKQVALYVNMFQAQTFCHITKNEHNIHKRNVHAQKAD